LLQSFQELLLTINHIKELWDRKTIFQSHQQRNRQSIHRIHPGLFYHYPDESPEKGVAPYVITIDDTNLVERISISLNAYRWQREPNRKMAFFYYDQSEDFIWLSSRLTCCLNYR
jgi:hypothetical protein